MNSLPNTVTRQRLYVPESSTLTTRLPNHPLKHNNCYMWPTPHPSVISRQPVTGRRATHPSNTAVTITDKPTTALSRLLSSVQVAILLPFTSHRLTHIGKRHQCIIALSVCRPSTQCDMRDRHWVILSFFIFIFTFFGSLKGALHSYEAIFQNNRN